MKTKTRENLIGYSFIILWIVGFLAFTLYPLINSMIYSFNEVTVTGRGIELKYVGLKNFAVIFSANGKPFYDALKNFLGEVILRVPIILVFSIIIALLLNQDVRFRGLFRTIFFLPVIISSGPVLNELITQGAGGANMMSSLSFIETLKNSPSAFLSGPLASLFSEIIIVFWFSGVQVLLFLSSLTKINKEVYEAARVDGAGPWESFWKITLPSLKSIVFINAIYTLVLLATYSENAVIVSIKNNMFSIQTGYGVASAMAWAYFLVLAVMLALIALLFMPKRDRRR